MSFPLYNEDGQLEGHISNEEIYILMIENSLEEMKRGELRLKNRISAMIQEHRVLSVDIQTIEQKLDLARKEYLSKVGE